MPVPWELSTPVQQACDSAVVSVRICHGERLSIEAAVLNFLRRRATDNQTTLLLLCATLLVCEHGDYCHCEVVLCRHIFDLWAFGRLLKVSFVTWPCRRLQ
jgi:hypothetical protein